MSVLCRIIVAICVPLTAAAQANVVTPAPVLTATREIKIDGPTEDLVRISWVRVAPDGRIAFSQFDDRLVRLYDATGKLIGKFGRAGDGPGEFRNPGRAGWFGDSLWVYDVIATRLTIIPPSLGAPRIAELGIRAFMRGTNPTLPLITGGRIEGITRTGEILFSGLFIADSIVRTLPAFADNLERAFVRAPSSAAYQNFLGGMPARPDTRIRLGEESAQHPFPTRSSSAGMHDASRFVMVVPQVEGSDAGTFLVTSIGLRGDTIFSRRYPFRLDRIPAAEAQKSIDATVASLRRLGNPNAESFRARAKVPPAYTPFGNVVMGRDGSTWIPERPTPPTRPWLVLDPRGNVFGRVLLGERVTVHEADLNNIWTVELDADDLPSVVRFRIARSG